MGAVLYRFLEAAHSAKLLVQAFLMVTLYPIIWLYLTCQCSINGNRRYGQYLAVTSNTEICANL